MTLAAMLYTHNWALFFGAACGVVWLFLLCARRPRGAARLLVTGVVGFGGALVLYLPWVPTTLYQAAHTGAPWSEAPTVVALLGSPGQMLGPFAQVALILVGGAGLAKLFGAAAALTVARRPRRRVPARYRAADRRARLALVAAVAGVGEPLPRGRRGAAAAGGGRRARPRGPARDRGLVVAAALGAGDTAPDDKSNVRDVAEAIGPSLRARRPRRLHAARAGLRARLLPARWRAVRDADRAGAGQRA